jgi:hypothetical protein
VRSFALALISLGACLFTVPAWSGHTLTAGQEKALESWLALHTTFRVATDADCECSDDIQQMRAGGVSEPVPDYHPYRAVGDFNGDGTVDFAVVLIDRSKKDHNFTIAVFNGPYHGQTSSPAFLQSGFDKGIGLFFGPPRPKPYRLVLGPFESEGDILMPYGKTYRFTNGSD